MWIVKIERNPLIPKMSQSIMREYSVKLPEVVNNDNVGSTEITL